MAGAFRAGREDAIARVSAQLEIQLCYCPLQVLRWER
jgi:hypothetical protein